MPNQSVYAFWLDPEFLNPRAIGGTGITWRNWAHELERVAKMRALLGDRIILSNAQLTDAGLLFHLFMQEEFRRFCEACPDFLELRSPATERLGPQTDRLARIVSGLARTEDPDWISSTHPKELLVQIREMFKGIRHEEEALGSLFTGRGKLTEFVNQHSAKAPLLSGLRFALKHYLEVPRAPVGPPHGDRRTYDKVLEEAEPRAAQDWDQGEWNRTIQETLTFIRERVPANFQGNRSKAVEQLVNAVVPNHPERAMYLAIVEAWNVAVTTSLGAQVNSVVPFRDGIPLDTLFGRVAQYDALVSPEQAEPQVLSGIYQYEWSPSSLTWSALRTIREDRGCGEALSRYHETPSGETLDEFCRAAGGVVASLHPAMPPVHPALSILVPVASAGGGLVAVMFGASPVVTAAAPLLPVLPWATYEGLRLWMGGRQITRVAESIKSYAAHYNLVRRESD